MPVPRLSPRCEKYSYCVKVCLKYAAMDGGDWLVKFQPPLDAALRNLPFMLSRIPNSLETMHSNTKQKLLC